MFLVVTLLVIGLRKLRKGGKRQAEVSPEPSLAAVSDAAPPPAEPKNEDPYFIRYASGCDPVRDQPNSFRSGTAMPTGGEGKNSVSIRYVEFHPERDLIEIYDDRIWWESDNDDATNDTENDHLFHAAMEKPMCRLVEMVDSLGGTLKVQDSYRASGVHAAKSLHKQGRAVDVTWMDRNGDNLPLSQLARMCWAAGFNWVYFENKPPHIHASVRPDVD